VNQETTELFFRLEKLRSELARDARRSVASTVAAIAFSFALGVAIGHVWR
jgi:hypothetical protein